jgi:hypothetical protein
MASGFCRTAPTGPTPDRWGTVWLCRPGLPSDPCTADLTSTTYAASGRATVERASVARAAAVDCFYVYPTISGQPTINANLAIDLREREVAAAQASRFSQVCSVYAPVYRQLTLSALEHPARITRADALIAYDSVLSSFRDYLAHYNHGRGVIVIGHSQGASMLIGLLRRQVDTDPAQRRLLVSAMLLGGNVTVPVGGTVGGSFQNIYLAGELERFLSAVGFRVLTHSQVPAGDGGLSLGQAVVVAHCLEKL